MVILKESKRDDLLIPYYELVRDKIRSPRNPEKPISLGEFKGIMLNKLTNQGLIRNLSLGSNFYLAGATKYYFQGCLTTDKKAALLTGDIDAADNWDREICKRLNIVIKILRNAYIDTIGTQFEQPEDFGTLSLPRLLRKYNKKIEAELVNYVDEPEQQEQEVDNLDRNPNVGNGYRFEIMYNYEDCKKYQEATSPGAWCITYREDMFKMYTRNHKGHFVIFTKNGYNEIPRPDTVMPGFTPSKPHDEYGNTMIAFLQNNSDWGNSLITSRWNHHGPAGVGCEADRAYTLEEFCQITGVGPDVLKRIYAIWEKDKEKYTIDTEEPENLTKEEIKSALIEARRKLYYAQMVINTGEKVSTALQNAGVNLTASLPFFGTVDRLEKSVVKHSIYGGRVKFSFITDKNNIIFDSMIMKGEDFGMGKICGKNVCPGVYISKGRNKCCIYNAKYHEFLTIDGLSIFKKTPYNTGYYRTDDSEEKFAFEIKQGRNTVALISFANLRPIRLPNERIWFYRLITNRTYYESREIECAELGENHGPVIKLLPEENAKGYFYNLFTGKFFEAPVPEGDGWNRLTINRDFEGFYGYYSLSYGMYGKSMLFNFKNEKVYIYGKNEFNSIKTSYYPFILIPSDSSGYYTTYYLYDVRYKRFVSYGNEKITTRTYAVSSTQNKRFFFIQSAEYGSKKYIYDSATGLLLKNTFGYPDSEAEFSTASTDNDGEIWTAPYEYGVLRSMCPPNYTYDQIEEFLEREREKRIFKLEDAKNLEYLNNNCPINDESEPAVDGVVGGPVNEQRIARIVSEVLKKYM